MTVRFGERARMVGAALASLLVLLCACTERAPEVGVVPDGKPTAAPRVAPLGSKVFPLAAAPALDGPGRDAWQRPDEVVAALELQPGDRVGDVGCGTGYFTLRILKAVGPDGHVVGVDIQQGMLDLLGTRLEASDRSRVTLRCSAPERPIDPDDALDLVFCANTLKEVPDDDAADFVASMASGLVPGGRLAILDWLPEPMSLGPPLAHRVSPARIKELAGAAGLSLTRDGVLLPTHSFLIFTKAE